MITALLPAALDWKRPPNPREPASGYASRLAALNRMALSELMDASGISAREVHNGTDDAVRVVVALGGLTGKQVEGLRLCTPRREGNAILTGRGDERLTWRAAHFDFFRFCPHCIHEDLMGAPPDVPLAARPWLRRDWVIDQVRSCHRHGVHLLDSSRTQGQAIVDFSAMVEAEVLPRLSHLRGDAAAAEPNAFEEWVVRRLDGVRDPTNWLDGMPLHAAVAACECLGVEGLGLERPHLRDLENEALAAASLAGFRTASFGEASIERFLDTLIARSHAAGLVGLKKTYGYILGVLERDPEDPAFHGFRDIVRRHAIDNIPLPAGSQVLGQVLEERRLHTATSAAAASGTSHATLRAIFARCGLAPAAGDPAQPRLTIRVAEFEEQLRAFASGLKVADVVAETGMPKKHLLEFVSRGLLPTLFGSHEVNKARHRMARADVDLFMGRLFEGAVPVEVLTASQVPFGRACHIASTNIGDLAELVLSGRLSWKGAIGGGRQYTDLLVDAAEVTRLLQGGAEPRRNPTKQEIGAEVACLTMSVLNGLISLGALTVAMEFCPMTRRKLPVITRESYEAFRNRYVVLTEICHERNLNARVAGRYLAAGGVVPAFDPNVVKNAIYERASPFDAALAGCPSRGAIYAASHPDRPKRIVQG
ncbi:hypothetical protein GU700_21710 [Methylobacterium sp. NI91]|nr:hypothetical protein CLZ_21710 [Methylobacterium sp. CLZ]QIJ81867.1 hypothetical protein GU700_21710 [Methylobacterium sp. NI91]